MNRLTLLRQREKQKKEIIREIKQIESNLNLVKGILGTWPRPCGQNPQKASLVNSKNILTPTRTLKNICFSFHFCDRDNAHHATFLAPTLTRRAIRTRARRSRHSRLTFPIPLLSSLWWFRRQSATEHASRPLLEARRFQQFCLEASRICSISSWVGMVTRLDLSF